MDELLDSWDDLSAAIKRVETSSLHQVSASIDKLRQKREAFEKVLMDYGKRAGST